LPCYASRVNLLQLLLGTEKLCGIEYFRLVFLKYINVPTWSILLAWSQLVRMTWPTLNLNIFCVMVHLVLGHVILSSLLLVRSHQEPITTHQNWRFLEQKSSVGRYTLARYGINVAPVLI